MDRDPTGAPPEGTLFDEEWYLGHNPGIAEAVRSGGFSSGWDHYVKCGRAEGREPVPRWHAGARSIGSPLQADGAQGTSDRMTTTRLAYQLLLGREEFDDDIVRAQSHFTDIYDLRQRILNGPEHIENTRLMELARLLYTDESAIATMTRLFDAFLAQDPTTERLIAEVTDEAARVNAYAYFHTLRFRDQIRAAAALRRNWLGHRSAIRVLDVGQAPVTLMYARVIDDIELYTANLRMGTSADEERLKYGSEQHYFIDFDSESISERYPELITAPFDIILYCEVIEHIRASPREQIRDLLNILAPGGGLVVSTPNAMSHDRLRKLATGRKWDSVYSRENRQLHDEHHIHVREFTVTELLDAAREAGGEVAVFGVSDYYSEPGGSLVRSNYVSSRENQTVIIAHPGTVSRQALTAG